MTSNSIAHIWKKNYRLSISVGLQEVPPRVFEISDLVDLSLAGNRITSLPEDIKNLRAVWFSSLYLRLFRFSVGFLVRNIHLHGPYQQSLNWYHGKRVHDGLASYAKCLEATWPCQSIACASCKSLLFSPTVIITKCVQLIHGISHFTLATCRHRRWNSSTIRLVHCFELSACAVIESSCAGWV